MTATSETEAGPDFAYTLEALGQVVRELREAHKPKRLTQEQLGVLAGYKGGAGVAVSRIESGAVRPGPDRFAGLASAFGLSIDELRDLAIYRTGRLKDTAREKESPRNRLARVQAEIDRRTSTLGATIDAFNAAHDAARDGFFLPFVEAAQGISDAPEPPEHDLADEVPQGSDPEANARFRLKFTRFGVSRALSGAGAGAAAGATLGGAAAYASFSAAVAWGTASTGAAISALSGAAASNAALALLGGGTLAAGGLGIAGGTALLTGLVAGPAVLLAAGGVLWALRRSKQQEVELTVALDKTEMELDRQAPGIAAFCEVVGSATSTLDYLALHGAHALARWSQRLSPPVGWADLAASQRETYDDFVQLCAAQLSVSTLDVQGLLVHRGDALVDDISLLEEIVKQSDAIVREKV